MILPVPSPIQQIEQAVSAIYPDAAEVVVSVSAPGRAPLRLHVCRLSPKEIAVRTEPREPTPAEQAVIAVVGDATSPIPAKQIARTLGVTYSYTRRLLARMVRRGHLRHVGGHDYGYVLP